MSTLKKRATPTPPMMTPLEGRCMLSAVPLDTGPLTGNLRGKLPYTAIAGQNPKIQQNLLITNSSNDPVDGNVTADLFLSADGAIDSSSVPLGSQGANVYLRPYDQFVLRYKITSTPITTPAGAYQVIAQITDPNGNITYADSGITISIAPPNIDFTGSFPKPLKPGKNGKTKVSFTLTNNGNTMANGPLTFNVEQSTGGALTDASYITNDVVKLNNLKGGKSKKISETIPLPAGTYVVVIQLDPSNAFDDTNTANNLFASSLITVG